MQILGNVLIFNIGLRSQSERREQLEPFLRNNYFYTVAAVQYSDFGEIVRNI